MGSRLTNSGRKGAIEAAMIPRFISSLSFVIAAMTHGYVVVATHMANTALAKSSSERTVRACLSELRSFCGTYK